MEAANRYRRQNILFILTDDQHFRALGTMRNGQIRTPYLDLLARHGAHLTHCYAPNPVSSASRASLITGQYGFQNGITYSGEQLNPQAPHLTHLLFDRGYQTAFTGKWDNDGHPPAHGFHHTCNVLMRNPQDGRPTLYETAPDATPTDQHITERLTDGALALIRTPLEEPFFLLLAYTAPQGPREVPDTYEAIYSPDAMELPPSFTPAHGLTPDAVKQEIAHYYARVSHLDTQIGRIIEFLKVTGQIDNTLIIITSDNGLSLGAHGFVGKQSMYEECLRVPLIISGPDIRRGVRSDALVSLLDLMPTICDVGGAIIPQKVAGRTLTPLLTGKREEHHSTVFGHYRDMFRMARTRRFKLIRHLKAGREELFDLEADPYEQTNLAASPVHADHLARLRAQLADWQETVGDTQPVSPTA